MSGSLTLRPYQEDAADFLYEHDRALILAPVGAGKTLLTLVAMRDMLTDGHVKRFLVVAPKRVCTHVWPVEAVKWGMGFKVAVAVGSPKARETALASDAAVVVINYDNLQWLAERGVADFDAIVFDELTKMKNPSGKRFKALDKVLTDIHIRWGLTGSFTSNGLEDTFGQCKIVDQALLGRSKGAFLQQFFYCTNHEYQQWEPRRGALEGVMQRIKPATYLLEPGEYKDTLPPLHISPVHCWLADMDDYKKMKRDLMLELYRGDITAANAAVASGKLRQLAAGFAYQTIKTPRPDAPGKFNVTQIPHWMTDHKMDALADLLEENQRDNTLVFYWFEEEFHQLAKRFPHAVALGAPDSIERWNAGEIEMLLAHPSSAGHGLNLQFGGNKIVFYSLPWSLELYEQAIGRLHRSGQRHDVWVYPLITKGTIDEIIMDALANKKSLADAALEALK